MSIAPCDWHDSDAYAYLLNGDRRSFAWEWLRRTPAYVEAWQAGDPGGRFGLLRRENPSLSALDARPIWSPRVDSAVLRATGHAANGGDRFDLSRLGRFATVEPGMGGIAHILLSDGLRSIRLDLMADAGVPDPMVLTWHVDGVVRLGDKLAYLAQFSAIARTGRFSRILHPPERRAHRWVMTLRVHDALSIGATHREIVEGLFRVATTGKYWRVDSASWRLRVQRLAFAARACFIAGPSSWLRRDDVKSVRGRVSLVADQS